MPPFQFKQFSIHHDQSVFKVNFDGVLLAAWADVGNKKRGLDIGAGTGVIALACCQRNEQLFMDAIELDLASANEAKGNFERSKFSERAQVIHGDIQSFALSAKMKYDFIISNPPYFQADKNTPSEKKSQTAKHTDLLSFEDLILAVTRLLDADGHFNLILPYQEALTFIELAKKSQLYLAKRTEVKSRREKPVERMLLCFSLQQDQLEEAELIIQNSGERHDYTEAYIRLVQDFYTIL